MFILQFIDMSVNISNRLCTTRLRGMDWILGREQIIFVLSKAPIRPNILLFRYRGFSYGVGVAEVEGHHSTPSSVEIYSWALPPLFTLCLHGVQLNQLQKQTYPYICAKLRFTQALLGKIQLSFDEWKKIVFSSTCLSAANPEGISRKERKSCIVLEYVNSVHKALQTLRNVILHSYTEL